MNQNHQFWSSNATISNVLWYLAGIVFFYLPFYAFGQPLKYDTLAGPLPALVKNEGLPYMVITDIEVLPDKTVTIEPGVILLFQNFTGLHVRGKLIVKGTALKPVVFTSEFDKQYNPSTQYIANPFDWNGVFIHSDGFGTYIENCIISYTVYGLVSETKFIRLDPITFKENGKSNLVIEKSEKIDVIANTPYYYVLTTKDASVDGVDVVIIKDPQAPKRNFFRYAGVVVGLGGIISGIAHGIQYKPAKAEWEEFNLTNPTDEIKFNKTSKDYLVARDNFRQKRAFLVIDITAAVLGTAAFTWSFTF